MSVQSTKPPEPHAPAPQPPTRGGAPSSGGVAWRVQDLLAKKAAGEPLSEEQIVQLVDSIAAGTMDHTQIGAFLMAVFIRGMSKAETVALTKAMTNSGTILEWPTGWKVGDKHSTGGVGDKVSIPLTPALAACGLKVPMISGRGLGHTGGTLDKLESIPGFNVSLTGQQILDTLEDCGCTITGQTADLVPADRIMYAARDVSSTVVSMPLIVSSILSKKAAESLAALVLDVKFGVGSFMKTLPEAEELAQALVETMGAMGVTTTALLTAMEHPIGRTIGNSLEVKEALDCLAGGGPPDLQELVVALGGELLASSGLAPSEAAGRVLLLGALKDGSAIRVFRSMLLMQGVEASTADQLCSDPPNTACLPSAPHTTPLTATLAGVIVQQEALSLAKVTVALGAGRSRVGEPIQHDVGIYFDKVVGEWVEAGEVWVTIHHRDAAAPEQLLQAVQAALTVDPKATPFAPPTRVAKIVKSTV